MAKKKRKIRADFRKNRAPRTRLDDWTKKYQQEAFQEENPAFGERIGKDGLSRRRTVLTGEGENRQDEGGSLNSKSTSRSANRAA